MIKRIFQKLFSFNQEFLSKDNFKKVAFNFGEDLKNASRTKKSIDNLALFASYSLSPDRKSSGKPIKTLSKTMVLFFAQDDFYDNKKISYDRKKQVYDISAKIIRSDNDKRIRTIKGLPIFLHYWIDIRNDIKDSPKSLISIWQSEAIEMNTAMLEESRMNKQINYEEYMQIATRSIGAEFLWVTYFVIRKVPFKTILSLDRVFKEGAIIARLSNDLASYYRKKNKINALSITAKNHSDPVQYIKRQINLHFKDLEKEFNKVDLKKSELWIKPVITRSLMFLINFYERGDFDSFNLKKQVS